jgi:DNA polymerase III alpha subunit (gram-positive type)
MSYFVVDVEADGPCPGLYSMISFGAVKVQENLKDTPTFYGELWPISELWIPQALAVSGFTREETIGFDAPKDVMEDFADWVHENSEGRPIFISDNNGFDWQFINYYFHKFVGSNPFGFSSRRLSDLYCGMQNDTFAKWKYLRDTKHTHHPVDDARGNAEVLVKMKQMGLKIKL